MTPDSKTETQQRVGPMAPGSVVYALFEHMEAEHGLTLLGSELTEIISIVNASLEARLEWWMRNAEGIAAEGNAKGQAETAILMAPVDAQIKLPRRSAATRATRNTTSCCTKPCPG